MVVACVPAGTRALTILLVNLRIAIAVARHPSLWMEAVRAGWAHTRRVWWRRLLLVPDPEYLGWRLSTAYGDAGVGLKPQDAVKYLRWRRAQRAL